MRPDFEVRLGMQVSTMVQEHREEVGRLHEYIQGSY